MKNLQICCGTRQICNGRNLVSNFPPYFSGQYPWLLTYDSKRKLDKYQIFSPIQYHHYHCRIPQLLGREIWGCFHGWLIMSKSPDNLEFCLWNLVTLKFINLPRLKLKSFGDDDQLKELSDYIGCCFMPSPPSNPDSVVILLLNSKPNIVFCLLRNKRRKWTQMSYANQIRKISNHEDDSIEDLALSNGKVYATTLGGSFVQIDIQVNHNSKKKEVVISLLPFGILPQSFSGHLCYYDHLSGCDTELFIIRVSFKNFQYREIQSIYLFRLDFSTMKWGEVKNVKDRVFFLDELSHPQICCPAIESEDGNYIHIIRDSCKLYSYNMEDKTISLSFLPCPDLPSGPRQRHHYLWVMPESRLLGDHGEGKCSAHTKKDQVKEEEEIVVRSVIISNDVDIIMNEQLGDSMEACLVNMSFHILELIAEHCVAVEYLNFRATCKQCLLAAPLKQWRTETALARLRTHSLVSPWLMICDKDQGILTFIDPKFGDKYFMTTIPESIGDAVICYSKYGWLLIFKSIGYLVFFNPFTRAIIQLPPLAPPYSAYFSSLFSAPPTSPDCIVVGFAEDFGRNFYITSPGATLWLTISINPDIQPNLSSYDSTAFCGGNLYVLCEDGKLGILRIGTRSWEILIAEPTRASCISSAAQSFLVECCNDLLSIFVDESGEWVEVFKLNHSSLQWEKADGLGNHMIYVCCTTSFSVVAKSPGMENKIYFPKFRDGNLICYSLSTCNYRTFGYKGKDEQEFTNFLTTEEPLSCVWIEPSWAS